MSDGCSKTLSAGTILNEKYVVLEFLGKGGMGEVYRAHQLSLDRFVAIKVISREWAKSLEGDAQAVETALERFRREVQLMARIHHPNVLQIFDYDFTGPKIAGEGKGLEYIAMEYIPGGTLRNAMPEEGLYPDEENTKEWLKRYFTPLLDGVCALHEAGIIHRDIKPENVLLDRGTPKIADFGLAQSYHLQPLTKSMEVRGTPPYMSPEHFLDLKRTDERTDIYALGKILYEVVAGKMTPEHLPFRQATLSESRSPLFHELDLLIREATAEEKADRFTSAAMFKEAIEGLLGNHPAAGKTNFSVLNGLTGRTRAWRSVALAGTLLLLTAGSGLGNMIFPGGPRHAISFDRKMSNPEAPGIAPLSDVSPRKATTPPADLPMPGPEDFPQTGTDRGGAASGAMTPDPGGVLPGSSPLPVPATQKGEPTAIEEHETSTTPQREVSPPASAHEGARAAAPATKPEKARHRSSSPASRHKVGSLRGRASEPRERSISRPAPGVPLLPSLPWIAPFAPGGERKSGGDC